MVRSGRTFGSVGSRKPSLGSDDLFDDGGNDFLLLKSGHEHVVNSFVWGSPKRRAAMHGGLATRGCPAAPIDLNRSSDSCFNVLRACRENAKDVSQLGVSLSILDLGVQPIRLLRPRGREFS